MNHSSLRLAMAVLLAAFAAHAAGPAPAQDPVWNRLRVLAAPGSEAALVGGRLEGSNVSRHEGFEKLAELAAAPQKGQWAELTFDNHTVYRWLRFVPAPGKRPQIAEIEFLDHDRKLSSNGAAFGPIVKDAAHAHRFAVDEKPNSFYQAGEGEEDYIGMDVRDQATARRPILEPAPADLDGPVDVKLRTPTPSAVIRYTLDGTMPTATHGEIYTKPLHLEKTTTLNAVAFVDGRAPSPPGYGVYVIHGDTGLNTFHVGNSLTQTTSQFSLLARTAGFKHEQRIFARPGAWTKELWDIGLTQEKQRWDGLWNSMPSIDHFTL
jgi:hypothetical protein